MAYGWYTGAVTQAGVSESTFRELIGAIWDRVQPSVIFLFLAAREEDPNNASGVEAGYRELAKTQDAPVILVPDLGVDETQELIIDELLARTLAQAA